MYSSLTQKLTRKKMKKIELSLLLAQFKEKRKKLRYIRYPLAVIQYILPQSSRYANFIRYIRILLRIVKYYIYFMITFLLIYLKFIAKD